MVRILLTKAYRSDLVQILNHIAISAVDPQTEERFLAEHDRVLRFLKDHPYTPAVHPVTGDQSWVFGEGRYRLFFKAVGRDDDCLVYLTHVIDNRRLNFDVYPSNTIPTYDED